METQALSEVDCFTVESDGSVFWELYRVPVSHNIQIAYSDHKVSIYLTILRRVGLWILS